MSLEQNPACILFRFHDNSSAYQVEDAFQMIQKISRQQGIRQVLFDLSAADDPTGMLEQYQVDQKLGRRDLLGVRLAAFGSAGNPSLPLEKQPANLMIFDNELAAREWLFQHTGAQNVPLSAAQGSSNFSMGNATV